MIPKGVPYIYALLKLPGIQDSGKEKMIQTKTCSGYSFYFGELG